jgi:dihydroorotase
VTRDSLLSLCKWSPFEGYIFSNEIESTFVNGTIVYTKNKIIDLKMGSRLVFDRQ